MEEVGSSEVGSSEVGSSEVGSSEVGSSEVGSSEVSSSEVRTSVVASLGKVSLSEKVMLVLLAVEASAVKEGSGFLSSRLGSRSCDHGVCYQMCVPSRACAIKGLCHQGVYRVRRVS